MPTRVGDGHWWFFKLLGFLLLVPLNSFLDGDGALNNDAVQNFCDQHGVGFLLSSPCAPWQNGLAERHGAILATIVERFYLHEEDDPTCLPVVNVILEHLLPVIQSRKNGIPGAADVGGMSPFELFLDESPYCLRV